MERERRSCQQLPAVSFSMILELQFLVLWLHKHTLNKIRLKNSVIPYDTHHKFLTVIASYNHVCLNTVETEGCNP